jgi:Ras-related protein Rab-1A
MRFIVGNKCDLDNKRKVSFEEGRDIARQYNVPFFETSAKDTMNIDELFLDSTKVFIDRQMNLVRRDSRKNLKNGISVENINEKKKKKCC